MYQGPSTTVEELLDLVRNAAPSLPAALQALQVPAIGALRSASPAKASGSRLTVEFGGVGQVSLSAASDITFLCSGPQGSVYGPTSLPVDSIEDECFRCNRIQCLRSSKVLLTLCTRDPCRPVPQSARISPSQDLRAWEALSKHDRRENRGKDVFTLVKRNSIPRDTMCNKGILYALVRKIGTIGTVHGQKRVFFRKWRLSSRLSQGRPFGRTILLSVRWEKNRQESREPSSFGKAGTLALCNGKGFRGLGGLEEFEKRCVNKLSSRRAAFEATTAM